MVNLPKKFTLTYFRFANRAEPIRLAFAIGKIPFTNKVIQFQDFGALKSSLPMGQLPLLEVEGQDGSMTTISQSQALLRYVGKLSGLYPTDEIEACKVDEICAIIDDASTPIVLTVQGPVKAFIMEAGEWNSEEKIAIRQRAVHKANGFPLVSVSLVFVFLS